MSVILSWYLSSLLSPRLCRCRQHCRCCDFDCMHTLCARAAVVVCAFYSGNIWICSSGYGSRVHQHTHTHTHCLRVHCTVVRVATDAETMNVRDKKKTKQWNRFIPSFNFCGNSFFGLSHGPRAELGSCFVGRSVDGRSGGFMLCTIASRWSLLSFARCSFCCPLCNVCACICFQ